MKNAMTTYSTIWRSTHSPTISPAFRSKSRIATATLTTIVPSGMLRLSAAPGEAGPPRLVVLLRAWDQLGRWRPPRRRLVG